jgi:hypothetical protein
VAWPSGAADGAAGERFADGEFGGRGARPLLFVAFDNVEGQPLMLTNCDSRRKLLGCEMRFMRHSMRTKRINVGGL